ncbi:EAL domain-containing protein [Paenirhodobacter sp.]|uniref:EAL domain-containing protein n=1 Tax=Paenirhodobacter sp. TaxID=1965326 RepID=UPI003B514686
MAIDEVRRLKNYGFSISLDDFGTGFSSLSYIRRIPFNAIKIDKSFISGSEVLRDDYCLVSAIVSLADSMGKGIIAEGVETERQLAWLRSIGCRYVQGFLFGRPERVGSLALRFDLDRPSPKTVQVNESNMTWIASATRRGA